MKNWLKNLLFVIFSFLFLGVGMVVAEFFIREKGNPLKDPNFLADTPPDTTVLMIPLNADSTQGWETDSVPKAIKSEPILKKENFAEANPSKSGDYQVIIGIFGERSNANREVKRLKYLGYKDSFSYSKLSMNVVCAGVYDKSEAEKISEELQAKGFDTVIKHQ